MNKKQIETSKKHIASAIADTLATLKELRNMLRVLEKLSKKGK